MTDLLCDNTLNSIWLIVFIKGGTILFFDAASHPCLQNLRAREIVSRIWVLDWHFRGARGV